MSEGDVSCPLPASLEHVLRVHDEAYLESLQDPREVGRILGADLSDEEAQATLDLVRLMVGGTIQATRLALRTDRVAVNLGGGFHHAAPDRDMGFCILNDVAIAIARLRAKGYGEPILVVDLDLHDVNGTRLAVASDPTVHTFSIHNVTWDDRPAVADTTIALGSEVTDGTFFEVLERELPPVIAAHGPEFVVYVAGCDGAADDRIGDRRLTEDGLLRRDRFVVDRVCERGRARSLAVASEPRFLDQYTRHGLELMLERLGFLDQLRARGYRRPTLTSDASGGLGHTVRIFGDPGRECLLIELRVSRRKRMIAGMEVLYVEWLLLQDPRAEFSEHRRRLPEQKHPGLGILSEVAAWLVLGCERLALDGIAFVPSHYFMAALGRRHLRFLDALLRGRFEAFTDAVAGMDVGEASRAIDQGEVVDVERGEPARWETGPMMVPVSAVLRRRIGGADYAAALAEARRGLRYRLRSKRAASPA